MIFLIVILLGISALAHGVNMFHFPSYSDDEGIYMAQAWAVLAKGQLAPSTYFYDHSPLGWIQIALWTFITGGFSTFGFSLNSGRMLMLIFHLFSCLLIFLIAKRLSRNITSAGLSTLIFSLSPLAIYFQRQVLLDNIMVFWLLLSLLFLLFDKKRLLFIIASAVFYGVAVLVKETALFFLPAMLYIVFTHAHQHHRSFAIIKWLSVFLSICFLYIIYALLKGEFFPAHSFLSGNASHVSLIETVRWQMARKGGAFINPGSQFRMSLNYWLLLDPVFVILGTLSLLANLIVSVKNITYRYIVLLTLFLIYYLVRGGVVIDFYIIPLIPLFSLNIGLSLNIILQKMPKNFVSFAEVSLLLIVIGILMFHISGSKLALKNNFSNLFTKDHTSAQIQAILWIKKNISKTALIVVDNYAYVDLAQDRGNTNIQSFWKIDADPKIRHGLLHNNWQNIDYIISSPSVRAYGQQHNNSLVKKALTYSQVEREFPNNEVGDIEVRKVFVTFP